MSDWWSSRIAGSQPAPQPATPPVTPPLRGGIRIPAVVANPTVQVQPQQVQQSSGNVLDPARGPQDQITMGEAIRLWKGGKGNRKETGSCPECGSHLVFSRSDGTMVNGASPAPRCYECGWNGRYSQGEQASWV